MPNIIKSEPVVDYLLVRPEAKTREIATALRESGIMTAPSGDYLLVHPEATRKEIVSGLRELGITITPSHVGNIKTKLKQRAAKSSAALNVVQAPAAVPVAAVEKPGDMITLDQIRMVAQVIKTMGGYQKMTKVLEVIKELGGIEKFGELVEAMTVAESDVVVS